VTEARSLPKHLSANFNHTTIYNAKAARSTERKVEDAAANIWSAISDADHDRLIARKIGDANFGAEREAAMGGCQPVTVERGTAHCFSFPAGIERSPSGKVL
jgi:hypothetical protein